MDGLQDRQILKGSKFFICSQKGMNCETHKYLRALSFSFVFISVWTDKQILKRSKFFYLFTKVDG